MVSVVRYFVVRGVGMRVEDDDEEQKEVYSVVVMYEGYLCACLGSVAVQIDRAGQPHDRHALALLGRSVSGLNGV
jgi:hypothetical protein